MSARPDMDGPVTAVCLDDVRIALIRYMKNPTYVPLSDESGSAHKKDLACLDRPFCGELGKCRNSAARNGPKRKSARRGARLRINL